MFKRWDACWTSPSPTGSRMIKEKGWKTGNKADDSFVVRGRLETLLGGTCASFEGGYNGKRVKVNGFVFGTKRKPEGI